jgi:tetratricopeptide (TPR) repeat protein
VRGDFPEAILWIDRDIAATSLPGVLASSYCWKAYFLYSSGEIGTALDEARHALAIADSTNNPGMLAITNAVEGFLLLSQNKSAAARDKLEMAIKYQLPPYQIAAPHFPATAAYFRGLVALKSGDLQAAERNYAEMKSLVPAVRKETPTMLGAINNRLATLASEIMLARGRANDAIKCFKGDFKIYAPVGTSPMLYAINVPFDQDILPRAYAAKGDLDKAIAEYKKLLTFDPASKDRRIKNPRYEYRLAKLLEKRGRPAEALEHYCVFLRYWKDADPDLPELIDAKARVAALGRSPATP